MYPIEKHTDVIKKYEEIWDEVKHLIKIKKIILR